MFSLKLLRLTLTISIFAFLNLANSAENATVKPSPAPEQIHLSLGKSNSEMTVTWTTYAKMVDSIVLFGTGDKLDQTVKGRVTEFTDNGHRVHYINRATLAKLKPDTTYNYQCGSKGHLSKVFSFTTYPSKKSWSPKMLVYGDLGVQPGAIIPSIISEVHNSSVDLVFHNGDIAYDLGDNNSTVGDEFMRVIENAAAKVPFQTSIGNHETTGRNATANLENYLHRFSMADQTAKNAEKISQEEQSQLNPHYYAFYLGPAIVFSINMEIYVPNYNTFLNASLRAEQETWLIDRLKEANTPEERKKHPWIIVLGHQPLYCSSSRQDDSCTNDADYVRAGLEDIFFKYGVDIVIGAHIHNYEREYPMYKGKRAVETYKDPYHNPKGPVYIVSGAGGCPEMIDTQFFPRPAWNAFADSQFGYGILEIVNQTTVVYQQKAIIYDCACDPFNLQVIDEVEIIQEHHGPFAKFE